MEGKKGADKGIDGRLYFHEGVATDTKQVVPVGEGWQEHQRGDGARPGARGCSARTHRSACSSPCRSRHSPCERKRLVQGSTIRTTSAATTLGSRSVRWQNCSPAEASTTQPSGGGKVTFKSAQRVRAPIGDQLVLGDGG